MASKTPVEVDTAIWVVAYERVLKAERDLLEADESLVEAHKNLPADWVRPPNMDQILWEGLV